MEYPWRSRARYHGRRLAALGTELSPSLIGQLGYHEGADITVAAMADFSRELRAAYVAATQLEPAHDAFGRQINWNERRDDD